MSDEELRMDAYYYSFDKTGQVEIDRILSAVACAGKAFHYTNDWNDEATPRTNHEGATPIDWIQNRAKEAADTIEALRAENARLLSRIEGCEKAYVRLDETERRLREALKALIEAADNIRHWHDAMSDNSGMVVSRDSVFALWEQLRAARAAMGESDEQ